MGIEFVSWYIFDSLQASQTHLQSDIQNKVKSECFVKNKEMIYLFRDSGLG